MPICLAPGRSYPRKYCVERSCGLGIKEVREIPDLLCFLPMTNFSKAKPERNITLPYVLLNCFKRPVTAAVLPRLFLIVFRYSQPVLINIAVRYISNAPKESGSTEEGRWLIVAALAVYVGLAVSVVPPYYHHGLAAHALLQISKAAYQHQLNRLRVMARGALVGLIYQRSLQVRSASYEDGNAVTLMSTDVDNVQDVGEMFHETWAQFLEVVVGTMILATQIGWLFPVPLIIIVCKSPCLQ
jgi:ATP-binding cassette subfamily C (CFTR/MRP) protein 1